MKNDFEVRADHTVIFLKRRDGTVLETMIDTVDLPLVQAFPGTWFAEFRKETGQYRVVGALWHSKTKYTPVKLHRWIMNAPKGLVVDHINGDTLDNRRSNLRIVTQAQNLQNIHRVPRHNKSSGIRGVCLFKPYARKGYPRKWRAYVTVDGKEITLGYYRTKEEAGAVVARVRARLHPYSQEAREWACDC